MAGLYHTQRYDIMCYIYPGPIHLPPIHSKSQQK